MKILSWPATEGICYQKSIRNKITKDNVMPRKPMSTESVITYAIAIKNNSPVVSLSDAVRMVIEAESIALGKAVRGNGNTKKR